MDIRQEMQDIDQIICQVFGGKNILYPGGTLCGYYKIPPHLMPRLISAICRQKGYHLSGSLRRLLLARTEKQIREVQLIDVARVIAA